MTTDESKRQVALQYIIHEGSPEYVRGVLVSGLRASRPKLVDPNIRIEPGDPLSLEKMGDTQRRLYELGVFDKVDMAIQNPDGEVEHKYVLYQIEEGPRYTLAAGFGAEIARIGGSQTSLSNAAGQTGFSPRVSLDVSRLNLWGLGHSVTLQTKLSNLQTRGVINYTAPRYRNVEGRNIVVSLLYDNSRDVRTFSYVRLEATAQISKKFTKATNGLLRYSYRRVSTSNVKIEPLLIPLLSQPVRIGAVAGTLVQDRRDNPTDSHRGIYNTLDAELASNALGSQRNFLRLLARNSTYHRLGRQIVLARSLQLGWIEPFNLPQGLSATESIPFPERFFGGGSNSHRGFPENQAGPRDLETGFPLGGDTLLFHQTELRFPLISDNITGAIFHDMGNIYASPSHISFRVHQQNIQDFDYMVHAVGFGIRYRTPVGPIRLDLSYSINPPAFKGLKGDYQDLLLGRGVPQIQQVSHFQFFFSIGQAF
jgi:outer membrane protein assembly factor BamA